LSLPLQLVFPDLIDFLYSSVPRMGDRNFESKSERWKVYKRSPLLACGLGGPQKHVKDHLHGRFQVRNVAKSCGLYLFQ